MSLRKRLSVFVAVLVVSLTAVSAALANPWELSAPNGTYSGTCSVNFDTGWLNCHGTLVSGLPEGGSAVIIQSGNCTLVLAPAGVANMNCRKL